MKKAFLLIISVCLFFTSCQSPIKVGKYVREYEIETKVKSPIMDFIGFKIDTKILSTGSSYKIGMGFWTSKINNIMSEFDQARTISNISSLKNLGSNLENSGIAIDKSDAYFGIYSLQEMELYKTDNRYVTFVEVARSKFDYNDNKDMKYTLGGIGGGLMLGGFPFCMYALDDGYQKAVKDRFAVMGGLTMGMGGIISLIALTPSKTTITYEGIYNIYIYDTVKKSLIRKQSCSVNFKEDFKGLYTMNESSKNIVHDYIAKRVYNELMSNYNTIINWLVTLE